MIQSVYYRKNRSKSGKTISYSVHAKSNNKEVDITSVRGIVDFLGLSLPNQAYDLKDNISKGGRKDFEVRNYESFRGAIELFLRNHFEKLEAKEERIAQVNKRENEKKESKEKAAKEAENKLLMEVKWSEIVKYICRRFNSLCDICVSGLYDDVVLVMILEFLIDKKLVNFDFDEYEWGYIEDVLIMRNYDRCDPLDKGRKMAKYMIFYKTRLLLNITAPYKFADTTNDGMSPVHVAFLYDLVKGGLCVDGIKIFKNE